MKKLIFALICMALLSCTVCAADGLVRIDYDFEGTDTTPLFSGYAGEWGSFKEYEYDGIKSKGIMFSKTAPSAYLNAGSGLKDAYTGNFEINFDVFLSENMDFRIYARHFTVKSSADKNSGMLSKENIIAFADDGTLSVNTSTSSTALPSPPVLCGSYTPGSVYKFKAVYHGSDGAAGSYSVYLVSGIIDGTAEENKLLGTFNLESNYAGIGALYFKTDTESESAYAVTDNFSVIQNPGSAKADSAAGVGSSELTVYSQNFINIADLNKISVSKNGEPLSEGTDYTCSYQLKTQGSAEKLKWCVNPVINLAEPIGEGEFFAVDLSQLTDICGMSFNDPYCTFPVPTDEIIFNEIKKEFLLYTDTFSEFKESTALKTEISSSLFGEFSGSISYALENLSDLSDEEFSKVISIDSGGLLTVNRPKPSNEDEYKKLVPVKGKITAVLQYGNLPEYTLTRDFTVNKSNVFENYTDGTEYSGIFDGNPETFMTFENGAEITVNFDSPKAFGGFYIDGENTEIYYMDLDANKLAPFDKTPVKTDKFVFKISGENTVIRDIAAFCTDYCDELLSDENILKNYPFSFDGKTISEGNIVLPSVLCKYINLTWESSDESVIDLFGNVYAPQKTTTVTLTAQIPGGAKRVCTVTVQAKKVVDKKGTGSGGGSGSSSGLNYSKPANTLPAAKPDLPPTAAQLPFSDVGSSYWCYDTIKYLYENEIINGKTETEFCPEDFVTRAEFVKMLVAAGDISADDNEISFKDVKKSDWYYTYVKTAFNAGIVTGTGENTFGAGENITREDLCVMLGRALKFENASEFEAAFSDSDEISDYAKGYVAQMSKEGIISGYSDGTFKPQNCATRSECAKIIYSYIKLTGRSK